MHTPIPAPPHSSLKPLSVSIRRVAASATQKKLVRLGQIWDLWADIVGERLAAVSQPVALKYAGQQIKANKKSSTGQLQVIVQTGFSTEFSYQTGVILEKIHRLTGSDWIKRIHILPDNGNFKEANPVKSQYSPASHPFHLTPQQKNGLSEALEEIDDKALRDRLEIFFALRLENQNKQQKENAP